MPDQPSSAIIISDGGMPALLAASIEAERAISGGGGDASVMPWPTSPILAQSQAAAAASQARFHRLTIADPPRLCAADVAASPGLLDTLALLAAVEVARAAGCRRVVWPIQFHSDDDSLPQRLDEIGDAIDRALLVSRLAVLDQNTPREVAIETPLVDLTDRQIGDLIVDLDAPGYLAWWWRRASDPRAEQFAASERRVWLAALRDAGWTHADPAVTLSGQSNPAPEPA